MLAEFGGNRASYARQDAAGQRRRAKHPLLHPKQIAAGTFDNEAVLIQQHRFIRPGNRKVLVYLREYQGDVILCICNLARSAQPVEIDLNEFKGSVPIELVGRTPFPPVGDLPYLLTL